MITRREFLKLSAAMIAGLAFPAKWTIHPPDVANAAPYSTPAALAKKFQNTLRGVGPGGIPVAAPDATPGLNGAVHYTVDINQFQDTVLPQPDPNNPTVFTKLWGYHPRKQLGGGVQPQKHLGGIIVAHKGVPVQITFQNNLPNQHILPVDLSTMYGEAASNYEGMGVNAASVHLHGGHVPWISDGGPFAWFTPAASGGHYGLAVRNGTSNLFKVVNPNLQAGQAEYYYPNNQTARMMWYHDHAHDITRLNAYAGIASAYILRDDFEANLRSLGLPDFVENGGREIPLVIQDKIFVGSNINTVDPEWGNGGSNPLHLSTTPGTLWYPHDAETIQPNPPAPSIVPEMFGDTMLVNGTVYPKVSLEARRYRFRLLNACQSAFLNLQLYVADPIDATHGGITLDANDNPTNPKGPDFMVLGTEGGFLAKPVWVPSNAPFNPLTMHGSLLTAPAERWDFILDFAGLAGKSLVLYQDAPAPFPRGDPSHYSNTDSGPDTRTLMRFDIVPATSADPALQITTNTDLSSGIDPSPVNSWTTRALSIPPGVKVRLLTLNEGEDEFGRLVQTLGTNDPNPNTSLGLGYGRNYTDPATEVVEAGSVEVWQIANLTADTHPIHFHLVNVQILSRQPFSDVRFDQRTRGATPIYTGAARGPDPYEVGWKETVKMNPGEVTTVIMKFDMPTIPGVVIPKSLNPNLKVSGYEYVWHCHILEHEEHDMMRPLVVVDPTNYKSYFPYAPQK